jgi:hypothetical protein
MTSPDYASEIRPEVFPQVFRDTVRELGALVIRQSDLLLAEQQRLLEIPDTDLVTAQRRGHFCLVDIERWIARDFAEVMHGQQVGSNQP